MNWQEMLSEIRRSLKEPSTGGHWTEQELLRRANIGQRKIVRITGCLQSVDNTITTVSGQQEYLKPSKALRIIRVSYKKKRLYNVPISDLDIGEVAGTIGRHWQDIIGEPTHYYESLDKLGLYPKPNTTGEVISIEYVMKPNDLANSTDIPFNGVEYLEDYHDLIISYVLWRCLLEDNNQLFVEHKNDFIQGVMSLKSEMRNKPDELATFALIKRRKGVGKNPLPFMD